ncbi:MAG TPA: TIGR03067 domain-containing protein [Gemmataceae bacterium]|nr:TIGR03067 domain-containing protein [Gemmataceae bacterium]
MIGVALALALAVGFTTPAAGQKDDAAAKEAKKFQGTWVFVSMERDGKQQPKGDEVMTVTIQGDKFTVKRGDKFFHSGTQKLYPARKPKAIDARITEGEGKGTTMLGIYELDGDTLKVCFDEEGKARPTEFKSKPNSSLFVVVARRKK